MSQRLLLSVHLLIIFSFIGVVSAFASDHTTPPVISGVGSSNITDTSADINWSTDEPADTQVEYGTTTAYGLMTTLDTATTTAHLASLSGLTASTTYHYMVKSKDSSGNLATSTDRMFVTEDEPTIPPPPPSDADIKVHVKFTPKALNTNSRGKWVKVRVTFPKAYDARDVDTDSILLNGVLSPEQVKMKGVKKYDDDDDDRKRGKKRTARMDLKFSRSDVIDLLSGDVSSTSQSRGTTKEVTISGTLDSETFAGSSRIRLLTHREYSEGSIIKSRDRSEVYGIFNGMRLHIPSVRAFNSLGFLWSNIIVVSSDEIDAFEEEELVTSIISPAVYVISGGKKRHISSPQEFEESGYYWEDVSVVDAQILSFYPNASGITLIRAASDEKVYLISGGLRHWVPTIIVFNRRGYNWSDVMVVDEGEVDEYEEGSRLD